MNVKKQILSGRLYMNLVRIYAESLRRFLKFVIWHKIGENEV